MISLFLSCTVLAITFTFPPVDSQFVFRIYPRSTYYTYPSGGQYSSRHSGNPIGNSRIFRQNTPLQPTPTSATAPSPTEPVTTPATVEPHPTQISPDQQIATLTFLQPSGLNITVSGPYLQSAAYLLHLHVNVNHDFKGLKRGDWNQDVTLPSGVAWSYTFPDIEVNPGDRVYYWVEVKGQDGEMAWFKEFKGFQDYLQKPQGNQLDIVGPENLDPASVLYQLRPSNTEASKTAQPQLASSALGSSAGTTDTTDKTTLMSPQSDSLQCKTSNTTYNYGKTACVGQILVKRLKFNSVEQIAGYEPEDKFTVFSHNNIVKNVTNYNTDVYTIAPLLLEERYGPNFVDQSLKLAACSSKDPHLCSAKAAGYYILPPVIAGRQTTENTMFFRYGVLEVTAKLPTGDWVVPELWLLPKTRLYGNRSGKIVMALSRGNAQLSDGTQDFSNRVLEAGVVTSFGSQMFRKEQSRPWSEDYHKFKLVWTPNMLQFFVDNSEIGRIQPVEERIDPLLQGTQMAPFDQEFYLVCGVHVGGEKDFPDTLVNKPWRNNDPKNKIHFWRDRMKWKPTWNEDTALHVAGITVKALGPTVRVPLG